MTSLDMHGFSISLLPISEEEVNALVESVNCSAWPGCREVQSVKIKPLPEGLKTEKPVPSRITHNLIKKIVNLSKNAANFLFLLKWKNSACLIRLIKSLVMAIQVVH